MSDLEKLSTKTTSYEYENGFLIDVVESNDLYEVYLYHKNYGIKEMMFGITKNNFTSMKDFKIEIVESLEYGNYIDNYIENYF